MVRLRITVAAGVVATAWTVAALPAQADCKARLPSPTLGSPLTVRDLVEINEMGPPDGSIDVGPRPYAVDPTGKRVAVVVVRADLDSNSYCHALVMVDISGGKSRVLATGGDFTPERGDMRGNQANWGTQLVATPAWSPDGKWVAWLRRVAGSTQAWIAATDGSGQRQATFAATDVEQVEWSSNDTLLYATRPAAAAVKAAIDAEGLSGWLLDDRVTPNAGPRPLVGTAMVPLAWFAWKLDAGVPVAVATPPAAVATSPTGARLAVALDREVPGADAAVKITSFNGTARRCNGDRCHGHIRDAWWQPRSETAWYLRREGWRNGESALYRLEPDGAPRRLLTTSDVLSYCSPAAVGLVCLREGSMTPRRLIVVDWQTGRASTIYDPNPDFGRFKLGTVIRLKWKNDRGLEAWGDLVLPPDYKPGQKLPLVLTQYYSRGFLRGGVGNEYPVFLFAQRGFAVLSLERPEDVATADRAVSNIFDINRLNARGWADRYSVQSSIEIGVKAALATGVVDRKRIGITGLSDGATSVRFALINSKLFAAAALSSCCVEPDTLGVAGPVFAKLFLGRGAPPYGAPDQSFWKPVALSLNADRIDTPLLMQLSDDEYQLGLGAFEALRARGKPVEMYVFPDEHHNKAWPQHRRAIYERNLDWFDFWLRGKEDPDPTKREQYARWEKMRARR